MTMSIFMHKQAPPFHHNIPTGGLDLPVLRSPQQKDKVVVVMGATGTGKSRLSIDLATHFPAEIVNSDKIQVYKGLDIVTNKIAEEERCAIPHHLLGVVDSNTDFTCTDFCDLASLSLKSIVGRRQIPIIIGGSNSFIEALIDDENREFRSRHECCFLWVDVAMPVLHSLLSERVDCMVEAGMVEEARRFFNPNADYLKGIRRAIGVPEFDEYFRAEAMSSLTKEAQNRLLNEAIDEIKINTCTLACRQLEKIHRLRNVKGWKLHRLDATDVFRCHGRDSDKTWEERVVRPSTAILSRFFYDFSPMECATNGTTVGTAAMRTAAMAAAATR